MCLRGSGINVVMWLTGGVQTLFRQASTREQFQAASPGSACMPRPDGMGDREPGSATRAMVLMAGVWLSENIDPAPLLAKLAEASPWMIHPAWGAALLGLAAALWMAYKRSRDMQRTAELSTTADLYEAIFKAMPCPMFCKNASGEYIAVNRAYEEAFGRLSDTFPDSDAKCADDFAEASLLIEHEGFSGKGARSSAPETHRPARDYLFRTAALESRKDGAAWVGVLARGDNESVSGGGAQSPAYSEGAVDYVLLSAINHDVRTPLTGILGALELLEYSELDTQQRALLHNAEGASKALQGILDDVLTLARLEAGAASREHQPFDPREVIMTALAGLEGRADITTVMDHRLAQRLLGDGSCLRQILSKLAAHAISRKLRKPWRFEVRVLAEGERWQSMEFVLELLRDTNTAEAPSPFSSAAGKADELSWIAACKFCEWMGFALQEQGRGWAEPRFVVRACFARIADGPSLEAEADVRLDSKSESATILVAEDHELVREVIGRQLEALGWSCDLVADGESALEALARRDYALLITDRYMPKMDGLELARRVRRGEGAARMPIVLLTANLFEDECESFSEAGVDEAMCKPTSLQSLSQVLARWVVVHAGVSSKGDGVHFAVQAASDAHQVAERLHAVFGGDRGNSGAVDDYLRLLCNEYDRLKKYVGEGDAERIREVAHSLSGMGSFFGAQGLAGLAMLVERAESIPSVIDQAQELGVYLGEFTVALQTNTCEFTPVTTSTNQVSDGSHRNIPGTSLEI